ncbi:MAG: hypothetical protein ABUL49_01205 [bacterium]
MASLGLLAGLVFFSQAVQVPSMGRFDRSAWPQPAGFQLDSSGFRVRGAPGDLFGFFKPLPNPVLVRAALDQARVGLPLQTDLPAGIEVNLAAPGFTLNCPHDIGFKFTCQDSPRLTTQEVTVDAPNPTPPTNWALVSFVETQVPVLLVFEKPVSLVLNGASGDWRLTTGESYSGDVYVRQPIGTQKLKSQVADLGAAVSVIEAQKTAWLAPPAHLKNMSYDKADGGVKVTWNYDRPFALVPQFITLLDPESGVDAGYDNMLTGADIDEGSQIFTQGSSLTIFFPERPMLNSEPLLVTDTLTEVSPHRPLPSQSLPDVDYGQGLAGGGAIEKRLSTTFESLKDSLVRTSPEDMGRAALLNAGLAAWSRLGDYRADHGFSTQTLTFTDPLASLRSTVFGPVGQPRPVETALRSPARLSGKGMYSCTEDKEGYHLTWKPSTPGEPLSLATPWPVDVNDAKGVLKLEPKPGKEWFNFTITPSADQAEVTLKLPSGQRLPRKV